MDDQHPRLAALTRVIRDRQARLDRYRQERLDRYRQERLTLAPVESARMDDADTRLAALHALTRLVRYRTDLQPVVDALDKTLTRLHEAVLGQAVDPRPPALPEKQPQMWAQQATDALSDRLHDIVEFIDSEPYDRRLLPTTCGFAGVAERSGRAAAAAFWHALWDFVIAQWHLVDLRRDGKVSERTRWLQARSLAAARIDQVYLNTNFQQGDTQESEHHEGMWIKIHHFFEAYHRSDVDAAAECLVQVALALTDGPTRVAHELSAPKEARPGADDETSRTNSSVKSVGHEQPQDVEPTADDEPASEGSCLQRAIQLGPAVITFASKQDWIDRGRFAYRASGFLSHDLIAIDASGRVCTCGRDFARAQRQDSYPVTVHPIDPHAAPSVAIVADGMEKERELQEVERQLADRMAKR